MEVCYQLPVLPLDRPVPQHVLSRRGAISFSSSSALFGCPNPRQLSQVGSSTGPASSRLSAAAAGRRGGLRRFGVPPVPSARRGGPGQPPPCRCRASGPAGGVGREPAVPERGGGVGWRQSCPCGLLGAGGRGRGELPVSPSEPPVASSPPATEHRWRENSTFYRFMAGYCRGYLFSIGRNAYGELPGVYCQSQ